MERCIGKTTTSATYPPSTFNDDNICACSIKQTEQLGAQA